MSFRSLSATVLAVGSVGLGLLLAGCDDAPAANAAAPVAAPATPATPPAAPTAPQAGMVHLSAVDAEGRPLADVTFNVYGTSMAGERVSMELAGGPTGRVSRRVPDGLYKVTAWRTFDYHGRTYTLNLDPAGGRELPHADSAEGISRDFVWKTTGPTPGNDATSTNPFAYYGCAVRVEVIPLNPGQFGMAPPLGEGEQIELILEPDGPLIDGSTGKSLTLTLPNHYGKSFLDQPPGRYRATARLTRPDGTSRPLQLAWRPHNESAMSVDLNDAADAVTVLSSPNPGKFAKGLAQLQITIWY